MIRARQIAAVSFLALSIFIGYHSLQLSYLGPDYGPGAGFFSFWLSVLLGVFSVVEFVNVTREPKETTPQIFFPGGKGRIRILGVIGALTAVVVLIEPLGYTPTIFLFCLALLVMLGMNWVRSTVLAIAISSITYILFDQLQVLLPKGPLGF